MSGLMAIRRRALRQTKLSYPATVLGDGPSLYYRLGEASGNPIDQTAKTTATWRGAPVLGGASLLPQGGGHSVHFPTNGTGVHVADSAPVRVGPPPWTFEVWLRAAANGFSNNVSFFGDPPEVGIKTLWSYGGQFYCTAGGQQNFHSADGMMVDQVPQHFVVAVTATQSLLYVNGVLSKSLALVPGSTLASTGMDLNGLSSGNEVGMVCDMQELAFYPYTLSAAQVAAHYAAA